MGALRITYATASVVQALDLGYRYGFDIAEATGLRGGTVYPILRRLKDLGLAKDKWEPVSVSREAGRPPRKYYQLTEAAVSTVVECRQRYPLVVRGQARGPHPSLERG